MTQDLIWQKIDEKSYKQHEKNACRLPLTQSHYYDCNTYYALKKQTVTNKQELCAICATTELKLLKGLIHIVLIDRGPVWMNGFGNESDQIAFIKSLTHKFPKRIRRKRRFIDESFGNPEIIQNHKWKRIHDGYTTLWLDITKSLDEIKAGFKKNWRNALSKAQKEGIQISWDDPIRSLPYVLKRYELDKKQKGYTNLPVSKLDALAKCCHTAQDLLIGRAKQNDMDIGFVLILCHGQSATYQAGWVSKEGRNANAHQLLLWDAIKNLKDKGIKDFDLGGIHDNKTQGIASFKKGMGGDITRGSGLYV